MIAFILILQPRLACKTSLSFLQYIVDKVELMPTATVYVNNDGRLNDSVYDYDTTGYPFLYPLGQTIYKYELNTMRTQQAQIGQVYLQYEKKR